MKLKQEMREESLGLRCPYCGKKFDWGTLLSDLDAPLKKEQIEEGQIALCIVCREVGVCVGGKVIKFDEKEFSIEQKRNLEALRQALLKAERDEGIP